MAPDKFRGSLTAAEAADAMAAGLEAAGLTARRIPLADGGEGTLDALLAARGGSTRSTTVTGPLGVEVEAQWALIAPLLDTRPTPVRYEPGTEGPDAAADLPARDGRRWRPLVIPS